MNHNFGNKFHAKKVVTSIGTFDSKKEFVRWGELLLLQKNGYITNLERQFEFELIPKNKEFRGVKYRADFTYVIDGCRVVEDVKGCKVGPAYQIFVIKKKLMYHVHKIIVKEI